MLLEALPVRIRPVPGELIKPRLVRRDSRTPAAQPRRLLRSGGSLRVLEFGIAAFPLLGLLGYAAE